MLTYREISEILKMVDASDCEEFILELEGIKLVIRRGSSGNTSTANSPSTSVSSEATPTTASAAALPGGATASATTASKPAATENAQTQSAGLQLRSPMVGTFYRRPAPDKDPFVEVGDRVEPGTPLCMIEVMKLYTTVESAISGSIKEILATDGEPIEYDQLLFIFDAD